MFTDPHEITFNGITRIQNRVLQQLGWHGAQTEACVFAYLEEQGWARADIDAAIDALLDMGLILPTISAHRDSRYGHQPMLRRAS